MAFDLAALRAALVRSRMKQAQAQQMVLPMPRGAGMIPPGNIQMPFQPPGGQYQPPFNGQPEPDYAEPQATYMGAMSDQDRWEPMAKPPRRKQRFDFSPIQRMLESYYAAGAPAPTRYGSDMIGNQGGAGFTQEADPEALGAGSPDIATLRDQLMRLRRMRGA